MAALTDAGATYVAARRLPEPSEGVRRIGVSGACARSVYEPLACRLQRASRLPPMAALACSMSLMKEMPSQDADSTTAAVAAAAAVSILLRGSSPPAIADYLGLWDTVGSGTGARLPSRSRPQRTVVPAAATAVQQPSPRGGSPTSSQWKKTASARSGSNDLPASILNCLKELRINGSTVDGTGGSSGGWYVPTMDSGAAAQRAAKPLVTASCRQQVARSALRRVSAGGSGGCGGKRVTFADHRGLDLESVRVIHEATDSPPQESQRMACAAAAAAQAAVAAAAASPRLTFRVDCKQPVSDYAAFRERLARQNVALENVTLVDGGGRVVATVKVKNLAFEKRVFVRMTADNWRSYKDLPARYVDCRGSVAAAADSDTAAAVLSSVYDTFVAEADVLAQFPCASAFRPVEFAVCYESEGTQYWDSNDGQNYRLLSERVQPPSLTAAGAAGQDSLLGSDQFLWTDVPDQRWSDYAAWRHVDQDVPYW